MDAGFGTNNGLGTNGFGMNTGLRTCGFGMYGGFGINNFRMNRFPINNAT